MIGIDTNVMVRYLTQDDPVQSAVANEFLQNVLSTSQQGFISLVVLAEICWVLQSSYEVSVPELVTLIENLLQTPKLSIENRDCVRDALRAQGRAGKTSAGFVDFLINEVSNSHGCEYCVSFDKKAVRATGMKLLPPSLLSN